MLIENVYFLGKHSNNTFNQYIQIIWPNQPSMRVNNPYSTFLKLLLQNSDIEIAINYVELNNDRFIVY